MKQVRLTLILTLILLIPALAQRESNPELIPPGSKVYIEPMDGFENYITAAFDKKKVPLINIRTSIVAFSVASHKDKAWSGYKSAAEHIAKNVAKKIKKDWEDAKK